MVENLEKNIHRIHLHFVYSILRLLKLNKIKLLETYINIFNKQFNKNYKINIEQNDSIITIKITMKAKIQNSMYIHTMSFISDKKDDHFEFTELMNSLIEMSTSYNTTSTKELTNFQPIRYKIKM